MRSAIILSQAGCLLPFLIFFNLFFGRIFLKPLSWLIVGAVLILLFILNSFVLAKKIAAFPRDKRDNIIDIEGEVVENDLDKQRKRLSS